MQPFPYGMGCSGGSDTYDIRWHLNRQALSFIGTTGHMQKKKVYRDLLITPLGYAAAETYLWQCLCATKALDALTQGLPIEGDLTNGVYSSIRSWLFFAILLRFHPFLSSLSRPSQHCCILFNGYFS